MPSQEEVVKKFQRIGIVGSGNMGSMMAFAFSEIGLDVSIWDVKYDNVQQLLESAKNTNYKGKIEGFKDVSKFTQSLEGKAERKIFLFSITHGDPADSVLDMIKKDLKKGDIILDGGNENYRRTEARQKICEKIGVSWIGLGVSGGYQSARRGPSLSPGGDKEALDLVMPLLELLEIGAELLRVKKTPQGDGNGEGVGDGGFVLDDVLDKVVQDDDNTEGTPYWSVMESASRHISAPTLATAHFMRIASGNRIERLEVAKQLRIPSPSPIRGMKDIEAFKEHLHSAVYSSFLASFCQGLELIARASEDEGWDIDLGKCLQIWRSGCIIRSEGIADILQPAVSLIEGDRDGGH